MYIWEVTAAWSGNLQLGRSHTVRSTLVQTAEHCNPSAWAFASLVKLLQLMTHLKMVQRGLHDTSFKLSDPVFPFLLSLSSHIAGLLIVREVKGMQDSTLVFFVPGLQDEDDDNLCDSMLVCNQMHTEINFYLLQSQHSLEREEAECLLKCSDC